MKIIFSLIIPLCLLLCGCSTPGRIISTAAAAGGGAFLGKELGGTTGAIIGGAGGAILSETAHAVGSAKLKASYKEGFLQGRAQAFRHLSEEMRRSHWPAASGRFDARPYSDYPRHADLVIPAQQNR